MNIVVCGYVAPFPSAGLFWHYAQYLLGFRSLGHEVWYLEDSGDYPWGWDLAADEPDDLCRHGCEFLGRELGALGLGDRWVFRHASGHHAGMDAATTAEVLGAADLVVNVSCSVPIRPDLLRVPARVAVDTDPVFTQVKVADRDRTWASLPDLHTRLFTFGRPPLPAQGHEWVPTRQPVCLDRWRPAGPPPAGAGLTTLTSWQSYPPVTWEGTRYGTKGDSFLQLLDLPSVMPVPVTVALGPGTGRGEGAALLAGHGWQVADGSAASADTPAFDRFLQSSLGELGLAKHGYVAARSGWFSERTCAYLASGRPTIVQDTGWTEWLPSGKGLLPFTTAEEAAAAAADVLADPEVHGRAARTLAEEHFDARDVLGELLERAL